MTRFRAVCAVILIGGSAVPSLLAQRAAAPAPAARVQMTIDSIMRGPDLVGWPQTAVRWSVDSKQVFFQWRKPGEKEPSTYVVAREGGEPRRLSDDEEKHAPP